MILSTNRDSASSPAMRPYWHWIGAAAGLSVGVIETGLLALSGVRMQWQGHDVGLPVALLFETSFALAGYLLGRLAQSRRDHADAAAALAQQLERTSASERAALQSEKLAAIGQLAAGIAHEVRNPLGVIRAAASMLRDTLTAPSECESESDAAKACRFIQEETDRLNRLVQALLAFARPAALEVRSCDAEQVAGHAELLARETLRTRDVTLERQLEPGINFRGDPNLIAQVLFGLLVNAAEAVERGGKVILSGRRVRMIELSVRDDGPGVSPEEVSYLFEPFFTTKPSGTGLGLCMAARVLAAHDGRLEYRAGEGIGPGGRGACFRITLPPAEGIS